jgi:hypothetical protein
MYSVNEGVNYILKFNDSLCVSSNIFGFLIIHHQAHIYNTERARNLEQWQSEQTRFRKIAINKCIQEATTINSDLSLFTNLGVILTTIYCWVYIAPNGKMIDEWWIRRMGKGFLTEGGSASAPAWKDWGKPEKLIQDSRWLGRDSYRIPVKYKL